MNKQPKHVKEFLSKAYPSIKQRAKKEHAQIHWADETDLSSVEHHPRGYAPKGKTLVLTLSQAARERVNMISSITNQGKVRDLWFAQINSPLKSLLNSLSNWLKTVSKKSF